MTRQAHSNNTHRVPHNSPPSPRAVKKFSTSRHSWAAKFENPNMMTSSTRPTRNMLVDTYKPNPHQKEFKSGSDSEIQNLNFFPIS